MDHARQGRGGGTTTTMADIIATSATTARGVVGGCHFFVMLFLFYFLEGRGGGGGEIDMVREEMKRERKIFGPLMTSARLPSTSNYTSGRLPAQHK